MYPGALSKIDTLEVQVRVDADFSVVLAGQEINAIDYLLIPFSSGVVGVTGEAALHSVRSAKDAERAKEIRGTIADIKPQSLAQNALVEGLKTSHRFKSVTAAFEWDQQPHNNAAGVLRVRIENWGLYASKSDDRSLQKVEVAINASASLFGGDGKLTWEHKDHFTGGLHRQVAEYSSSPELLKNEIEETIRRYCARVANEIRYAP
jgi:hypothetical protein